MSNIISIRHLYKTFCLDKDNIVKASQDINLEIKAGEEVAIIGKSGSGKSTLMNIITCIETFDKGEYYFLDEDIKKKKRSQLTKLRNEHFGFIYQNFNLLNNLNAYENIELPLIYRKMKKDERRTKILEISERLGIAERLKHHPSELSGGEKQRVAIARALVMSPKIIVADEPTGALDEATGKQIMSLLKELNREGVTILIVTHDNDIANECKRIITLSDGKIIGDRRWQNADL